MIGDSSKQFTLRRSRSAYREFLSRRTVVLLVAIFSAVVVALTVSGAPVAGTARISPVLRLAYYVLCVGIGGLVCYSVATVALYVARNRTPRDSLVMLAGAMLVATVPCTAIAHVAQVHLFSIHGGLLELYLTVVAIAMPIAMAFHFIVHRSVSPASEEAGDRHAGLEHSGAGARAAQEERGGAVRAAQQARFFKRLPREPDGDIVYLKVRGHYLDVHTTAASCSALMRFADAIDDLDAIGLRVHRSYWVAHSHVAGLVRHGQSPLLRLTDGSQVPISRTYLTAVRAAFPDLFVRNRRSRAPGSTAADRRALSDTGPSARASVRLGG